MVKIVLGAWYCFGTLLLFWELIGIMLYIYFEYISIENDFQLVTLIWVNMKLTVMLNDWFWKVGC